MTTCWDQGYEALARGDLAQVTALLQIANEHLSRIDGETLADEAFASLRREADAARGRLEHGMKSGLDGLRGELRQARKGAKALSGYRDSTLNLGRRLVRDA